MIDEDTSHDGSSDGKKMGTTLPVHVLKLRQPEIGFMNQGGRLQSVARPLTAQVVPREPAKFFVYKRDQLGLGLRFSAAEWEQQLRNLAWLRIHFCLPSGDLPPLYSALLPVPTNLY